MLNGVDKQSVNIENATRMVPKPGDAVIRRLHPALAQRFVGERREQRKAKKIRALDGGAHGPVFGRPGVPGKSQDFCHNDPITQPLV